METTHHISPAVTSTMTPEPQHFLKLEDLHSAASPSPSYQNEATSQADMMQTSPPPVLVTSKPAKKRKSWGQALPEPTTTLPPRKRAKTDDEKEQRRIERIKRNRAAAHNSRERKRQETETLAVALAHANAKLEAYRRLHGPLPASVVLPEVQVVTDDVGTPVPSLVESHGTEEAATSPASPPVDNLLQLTNDIKQEPNDNYYNSTLPAFENLDAKPAMLSPLDPTQHSAAMLCDLQCRSSPASSYQTNHPATPASTTSTSPTSSLWAALFLQLMMLQLQTCYKTLLIAVWSLSPSRVARMMQASAHRLTSRSTTSSMTTPLLWRSMALAQRNAATGRLARPQGALSGALQRSMSTDEVTRARVGLVVAARQRMLLHKRKAFKQHVRKGHDVGKRDDADAGV